MIKRETKPIFNQIFGKIMEQASEIKLSVLSDNIYELARILLNPTRVEILKIIAKKEKCYFNDIITILSLAQSTLSTHIVELNKMGLILHEYDQRRTTYQIQWKQLEYYSGVLKKITLDVTCTQKE